MKTINKQLSYHSRQILLPESAYETNNQCFFLQDSHIKPFKMLSLYISKRTTIHCLSAKFNTSKQEVANASKTAEEILNTLEILVYSFDMKEEYVRNKMAEWSGLFERLEGLMKNVTDANETAHDAIDRGEETLRKAKDMLERLKVTQVLILINISSN